MELPIEKTGDDAAKWTKKRTRRTQYNSSINTISKLPVLPNPAVPSSPSSSIEFSGITTEEVEIELANSLILLSRGGNLKDQAAALMKSHTSTSPPPFIKNEDAEKIEMNTDEVIIPSCQLVEATAQSNGTEFSCKTCYKRFSSFQALGGHRASHKKPKLGGEEQTVQSSTDTGTTSGVILKDVINKSKDEMKANSPAAKNRTVNTASSKERAHVCQICNAEFNSGQALGGHMRRHKPINQGGNASKNKKEKSGIELDLNFPPLEHVDTRVQQRPAVVFPFEGNPPTQLSLGSPALTNCLYG